MSSAAPPLCCAPAPHWRCSEVHDSDTNVRMALFRDFVDTGQPPSTSRIADILHMAVEEVRAAMERLHAGKAIVLQPESREILMANPLCAMPTPYLVRA